MKFIERIFILILLTLPFASCGAWFGIGLSAGRGFTNVSTTNRVEVFSNISILSGNSDTIAIIMVSVLIFSLALMVAMSRRRVG